MEEKILGNPDVFPDTKVLSRALGNSYSVFEEMMSAITDPEQGLSPEWRYYRDGRSWLCKVVYRKKTVFWLSVWDGFFKTGFYFLQRNVPGVLSLDIDEELKREFFSAKPTGSLLPMVITMKERGQLKDVLELVRYKKSLK